MKLKMPVNLTRIITFSMLVPILAVVAFVKFGNGEPVKDPLPPAGDETAENYRRHVEKLKKKLPNTDFNIVVQPPFVVIGDEPEISVRRRSENTVKWAVDKLKANYFSKDPQEILNIWLFKDKTSYDKYTKEIFNDEPTTPYGYYSSRHKALIMNIGTGGGTLVHEIVHPFIEANFPDCPSWFNEGLASLYEQSAEKDGQIVGLTNWRLAGLQRAIRNKSNPTFKNLLATTRDEFYADETGVHYAQARYLCYYLQEKGLLVKFYRDFSKNSGRDKSGYETLQKVLGESDLTAFQKRWELFVLGLEF
jgi:hypothetical protein